VRQPIFGARLVAEDLVDSRERLIKASRGDGIDDRHAPALNHCALCEFRH
jgi:hypothetical protein